MLTQFAGRVTTASKRLKNQRPESTEMAGFAGISLQMRVDVASVIVSTLPWELIREGVHRQCFYSVLRHCAGQLIVNGSYFSSTRVD